MLRTIIPSPYPLYALRKDPKRSDDGGGSGGERPGTDKGSAPSAYDQRYLLCRLCGQRVTRNDARMPVNGSHRHTFCNPLGVVYEIGCFDDAMGLLITSSPTSEYSWFPGFAWQPAECRNCHLHLGWRFVSDGGAFFGFILDRLIESE